MAKFKLKENPDIEETKEILKYGLKKSAILIIAACCRVFYEGRAKSNLEYGDRVIIIKPDGSFLIHKGEKRNPVNWQPPGCAVKFKVKDDVLFIRSIRKNPKEILEVEISKTYMAMYFVAKDYEELDLIGSEDDMANLIFYENPEVIEEGFKPIAKEKSISNGVIDILGEDKNGNMVVLELKRVKGSLGAVSQLKRYVDNLKEENKGLRGILVAPSITDSAMKLLKDYDLEFRELHPPKKSKKENVIKLDFFD
jgi:RecB family endonuclease NucS